MGAPSVQNAHVAHNVMGNKQKAEDDAKNVHVNLSANTATDLARNTDILLNQNIEAVESVKNESRSLLSSVIETTKSYLSPRSPLSIPEAIKGFSEEDLQPMIMQQPTLERSTYYAQSSTNNLLLQSKKGDSPLTKSLKGTMSEGALIAAIFAVLGKQVKLREKSTETNQILVEQQSGKQKRLMDAYIGFRDRAESRKETSKVLGWTSFGAGLLGGIFAIGGIIATIATGGGALPIVLGVAAGIGGVAAGGTQIAGGVTHYLSELDAGEAFKTKQEKDLLAHATSSLLQDMESNDNSIAAVWAKIAQILRNVPKFFR